jgi:hypothetical protein
MTLIQQGLAGFQPKPGTENMSSSLRLDSAVILVPYQIKRSGKRQRCDRKEPQSLELEIEAQNSNVY